MSEEITRYDLDLGGCAVYNKNGFYISYGDYKKLKKHMSCLANLVICRNPETWECYLEEAREIK